MSIYCSFGGFSDDPCIDYASTVPQGQPAEALLADGREFMLKDEPCTVGSGCPDCGGWEAPWVYQKSHVMPQLDHERGGDVHLASIAPHISTPRERANGIYYADEREDWKTHHPWLRLGVNGETVVLHAHQVAMLRDQLSDWLARDFLPDEEYLASRPLPIQGETPE